MALANRGRLLLPKVASQVLLSSAAAQRRSSDVLTANEFTATRSASAHTTHGSSTAGIFSLPSLSSRYGCHVAPCSVMLSSRCSLALDSLGRRSVYTAVEEKSDMFCFQCEQTRDGAGCTTFGVCGKDPETAALQDLLIHALKGLSQVAVCARSLGVETDAELNFFVQEAIFSTVTNVNFDYTAISSFIRETVQRREVLRRACEDASKPGGLTLPALERSASAVFTPAADLPALVAQGRQVGVESRRVGLDEDVFSLQELLVYGIKGMAAYSAHAYAVGQRDPVLSEFIYEALDYISQPQEQQQLEALLQLCLKCGEMNLRAMEILNVGHCTEFGTPQPSKVRTSPVKGRCVLVSGHDLKDLQELLRATEGKGINVFTHGEMLPAHGYPELRKYSHLVGNYGGPWQLQKIEFAAFPGPIVVTTNCILEPKPSYQDRVFTLNAVGHRKAQHLEERNFQLVIEKALAMEGFLEDSPETFTMTGFGHDAVLSVADIVIEQVKAGKLRHIFLIGGCDGFEGERSYFHDLATSLPKDTLVLTLACGKYRFNKKFSQFGNLEGTELPRLMDIGQCNDAYSAIRIASALASAFNTDINSLPLSLIISWFEQKAVAVLLTLLHLGVKNVRIGPKLPAFLTPNILNMLVEKYGLTPIGGPDRVQEDMEMMLKQKAS
eukprot:TRINITY_DN15406_c0_g1_i1.p1 TRINITY_DN15406_c0_g1~~TRINITY_DN15406_c0_g1_i1.p1  ORF type:complete len:667 (-),score=196.07 TRINITY_DN15406_c0_g1_i1:225-2225(-)